MEKTCQGCQTEFTCNTNDINNCDCNTINLHPETSAYLKKTSYDCLCKTCLENLNKYPELAKEYPFPDHPNKYVQGVHYYLDGQYWVFTHFYHYLKGQCCKNNCRHCAYGYRPS